MSGDRKLPCLDLLKWLLSVLFHSLAAVSWKQMRVVKKHSGKRQEMACEDESSSHLPQTSFLVSPHKPMSLCSSLTQHCPVHMDWKKPLQTHPPPPKKTTSQKKPQTNKTKKPKPNTQNPTTKPQPSPKTPKKKKQQKNSSQQNKKPQTKESKKHPHGAIASKAFV